MNDRKQTFTTTSANGAALKHIRQKLGAFARHIDPTGPLADDVETIAAEVLDNLRDHGLGDTRVTVCASHGTSVLELEFRDEGVPFDPLQADTPEFHFPLSERKIGGLGIHIVRSLAKEFYYCRSPEGENVLTVRLSLREGGSRGPRS